MLAVLHVNRVILLLHSVSESELEILDSLHSFCYFLRLEFKVLDALIGRSLLVAKLLELPIADGKQGPVEEKYLSEPINSGVKEALIRELLNLFLFLLLSLTLILARILDEGL